MFVSVRKVCKGFFSLPCVFATGSTRESIWGSQTSEFKFRQENGGPQNSSKFSRSLVMSTNQIPSLNLVFNILLFNDEFREGPF